MSSPMKNRSPYKKLQAKNAEYVMRVSLKTLVPHKLHKIYKFEESKHPEYGTGQVAFLRDYRGKKVKANLPKKYLEDLSLPEDIHVFEEDIAKKENPYLIFREEMPDKSFRIDIVPDCAEAREKFKANEDYPELDNSNLSNDSDEPVNKKPNNDQD